MDDSSVLIVVDVQHDFCPGGALAVEGGDQIIPVINTIMPAYKLVVASQDWHPEGHISFASQHEGKEPFDVAEIDGEDWVLWPDHCVQATHGAMLHADLDQRPVKLIVRKGMNRRLDSYSVFFENDRETPTGLDGYLRGMGYTDVYLCGLALDVCVYFSAQDASQLGYRTLVIEDASRGIDDPPGSLGKAIDDMRSRGVEFIKSDDLQ
jgi:nicotinamidase/pyrazinamidase